MTDAKCLRLDQGLDVIYEYDTEPRGCCTDEKNDTCTIESVKRKIFFYEIYT